VSGNGGDDTIVAGPGFDTLEGGDGDDYLLGEGGTDNIFGDAGEMTASLVKETRTSSTVMRAMIFCQGLLGMMSSRGAPGTTNCAAETEQTRLTGEQETTR